MANDYQEQSPDANKVKFTKQKKEGQSQSESPLQANEKFYKLKAKEFRTSMDAIVKMISLVPKPEQKETPSHIFALALLLLDLLKIRIKNAWFTLKDSKNAFELNEFAAFCKSKAAEGLISDLKGQAGDLEKLNSEIYG